VKKESRLLGFAYDFGVTVVLNAVVMFLASTLMRGIHPLEIFKMPYFPGGECLS
jgi:hypothetical protein